MFHNLHESVNREFQELSESTIESLVHALENQGYVVLFGELNSMASEDIADAWTEFRMGGPEAAVSYLETMFGFEIEKS